MNHIVVTRLKFDDDVLFQNYFNVMKEIYYPAITNQINKDFKIAFIVNQQHRQYVSKLFNDNPNILFFNDLNGDYLDYIKSRNIDIQTRHDCDDWMSENYIEEIQKTYYENIGKYESFVIHTQPQKMDYNTDEIYDMGMKYGDNVNSMFLSLCQRKCNYSVFKEKHSMMFLVADKVFNLGTGYNYLVIHDNNKLSKILKGERKTTIKKDLSIIIPTYKNVNYIEECLDSIVISAEKYNCEILVGIDNCVETFEYVKTLLDKYNGVVKFYYFDVNVGPYVIKNTLAEIANSDKLLYFDSDDILSDITIGEVINELNNYEVVRFSYCEFNDGETIDIEKLKPSNNYGEGVFGIKKDVLLWANGFEPWRCAADSEFNWRLRSNGKTTKQIKKILFLRRRHNTSLTRASVTGGGSKVRNDYIELIKLKRDNGIFQPLFQLTKSSYYRINKYGELCDYVPFTNFNLTYDSEFKRYSDETIASKNSKMALSQVMMGKHYEISDKKVEVTEEVVEIVELKNEPTDVRANILKLLSSNNKRHVDTKNFQMESKKRDELLVNSTFGLMGNKKPNKNNGGLKEKGRFGFNF